VTLDELVAQTKIQVNSVEPLDLLAGAARRQQEFADLGEKLLDHFVQDARVAGCSWSQIGTALGVSKQAAQQRYSALRSFIGKVKGGLESLSGTMFKRFTPQVRQAVVLAQEESRRLHHHYLGTEHLVLGLLAEGEGIGAQVLQHAGITLDAARGGVEKITGRGEKTPNGHIPFNPRAKKVLELALREALHLSHSYIGTEHILLGLLRDGEGPGVQVLVAAGVQPDQLRATVLARIERTEAPFGTE
jgi:hypothetical protein